MKVLVVELISLVLCLTSVRLISGTEIDVGPVDVSVDLGFPLPEKYNMTQEDEEASNNGVSRMQYLRRFISTGLDRMPILDPYRKDLLEPVIFNRNNSVLRGQVNVRNLVAAGAKQFSLRNLEIRLRNNRVDFEIYVPRIDSEADFDAKDFTYENFEIDFSGHLSAKLKGYHITGAIHIIRGLAGDNNEGDRDTINLGSIHVNNNIKDVEVQLTQNTVPRTVPQDILDEIIEQVVNSVASTAYDEISNVLEVLTYQQLLDFLQVKNK